MRINTRLFLLLVSVMFLCSCVNEAQFPDKVISENLKIEKNKDISGVQLKPLTVHPGNYGLFVCKDSGIVSDNIKRLFDSEFNGYVVAALEGYSPTETHIEVIIVAIGYVVRNESEFSIVPLADVNFTDDHHADVMEEWYFCSITHPDLVE